MRTTRSGSEKRPAVGRSVGLTVVVVTGALVVSAALAAKPPKKDLRSSHGGYRQLDAKEIAEEELSNLAQFAASTLAKAEKKQFHDVVLNITEAHQQTVAGWNTKMKLIVAETGCPIRDRFDATRCVATNTTAVRHCDVLVYERPWEHIKELTSFYCH